jgi:putative CocE/NonD family hydrolase
VKLFFSSDSPDTDIAIRLTDVYPDGRSILVSDGITRTGINYPDCQDSKKEIDIDLWSTSLVFAKGHRIRISIAGSNYPRYERNTNVGLVGANKSHSAIAHNVIYTETQAPSRLILPIVRSGHRRLAASSEQ